jgi:hypothetical protein
MILQTCPDLSKWFDTIRKTCWDLSKTKRWWNTQKFEWMTDKVTHYKAIPRTAFDKRAVKNRSNFVTVAIFWSKHLLTVIFETYCWQKKKKILDLILISKSLLKNRFNSVTVAIFNTYGFIPFRLESDLFCIGFLQWAGTGSGDFLWLKEAWNLITQTLIQIPTTAMAIQVVEFSRGVQN